jgi:uncharacterized membrane protein YtjA (UPF0391 family)
MLLYWSLMFLLIAIIAGLFGFGGISASAVGIAQVLFFIFIVLFLVSLLYHLMTGRRPPMPPPL